MRKYGIPARRKVACQTVLRVFWCPLGFSSLGKRYGLHGDKRSWSRNASTAKGVNGTSATPLGVLESGIQTTAFSRSRCCFFMGINSLYTRSPVSVMIRTMLRKYSGAWISIFRSRPLVHRETLVSNKFLGPDRKKYPVVPIRFVQACLNGHISDLDWYGFVHDYKEECRRPLYVDERGTGGDLSDITIRCECGKSRPLIVAARSPQAALGFCKGRRPWLGNNSREQCGGGGPGVQINRLLIRSASNAYFPQVLSVISIPDANAKLRKAVHEIWEDFLQYSESVDDVKKERKKAKVNASLEGLSDATVFAEIERRRGGRPEQTKTIKYAEIETLLSSPDEIGEEILDGDFFARVLPKLNGDPKILDKVERIVLVHRLREVVAQVGFTRFEAAMNEVDGELNLDVRRAPLAREISWLPAVENRGEGIFIAFKKDAIKSWMNRPAVQRRGMQLLQGFQAWLQGHPGSTSTFPGLPYVMLHSLSHLLITAVSLECGYSASAIRERIYAGESGYGILLHTGTQ